MSNARVSDAAVSDGPVSNGPVGNAPLSDAPVSNAPVSNAPVTGREPAGAGGPALPVLAPSWEQYLDRLQRNVVAAEAELAAGRPMSWPDLALPVIPPSAGQRERLLALQARMAELLAAAEQYRDRLRGELSGLSGLAGGPRPRVAGEQAALGHRFDLRG